MIQPHTLSTHTGKVRAKFKVNPTLIPETLHSILVSISMNAGFIFFGNLTALLTFLGDSFLY